MKKKVTIIGAGHTGVTTAFLLATENLCDIVLLSRNENKTRGLALDILESTPIINSDVNIIGSCNYEASKDSDIVVITAGAPRKKGMSRDELIMVNRKVIEEVTKKVIKYSPNCIIIVLTNPVDLMTYLTLKVSGFPKQRVIGQSGVLDSARLRTFIAQELNISVKDVNGFVLGGHGDSMVPLIRYTNVAGIPVTKLISTEKLEAIVNRTRYGGGEIVQLLESGSAYYAPSSALVEMISVILKGERRILSAISYLDGEYGYKNICFGVPVILSEKGVEKVIELDLTQTEVILLDKSVADIIENLKRA
jgi:malate dehydrogenase